jgi:hypothetical protein
VHFDGTARLPELFDCDPRNYIPKFPNWETYLHTTGKQFHIQHKLTDVVPFALKCGGFEARLQ